MNMQKISVQVKNVRSMNLYLKYFPQNKVPFLQNPVLDILASLLGKKKESIYRKTATKTLGKNVFLCKIDK